MEKKDFAKGFLSGIIAVALCATGGKSIFIAQGFITGNMSVDTKIKTIQRYIDNYYVEEADKKDMEEMMYAGLVAGLGDPYTSYIPADSLQNFMDDATGEFVGIGIEYTKDPVDGNIIVAAPIEDSPAQKAGIRPNDKIIKINGENISPMDTQEIQNKFKGKEGTKVTVTLFRASTGETLEIELTRAQIETTTVKGKMLENDIAYIKITSFKEKTYDQFMKIYKDMKKQNMKGLVIDLRNNLGGLVNVVSDITDELVPEGTLVYTIDKQGNREDTVSDKNCVEVPLVLLVNEYSASSSEIMAGAVQDMEAGKLVGTQTFGKGLVQGLYFLRDGSALKITIQKYYTPKGVCIHGVGITPDYKVELPEEYQYSVSIPEEKDTQLQKAIDVLKQEIK